MQFVFLKNTGETLFVRNDAMTAQWTQEEMSLTADFPFDSQKKIEHGQWIAFQWNSEWQIFEIKNCRDMEPNHFQQITAESIVISELTDEHIDQGEYDNLGAGTALQMVLSGTLWSVGDVQANPVSSADIGRGTVWQAINTIKDNWNVYIEPKYTLDGSGNVGRRLDILPTGGTFNGLRLSVEKNINDPSVTWDDSNLITAIKGYGATIHTEDDEEGEILTFADAVWTQTTDHPAKPLGDEWLIDPEANALYSRNGRPRRGFYQNTSIEDPMILLQKSWEALREKNAPDIQIEGTVTDLYRLGYADEPIRLHDLAIVEIKPTGFLMEKEIIRLTVDLLNPANTTPTIGSYIPNIIYINRRTNETATGSGGGGGRGSGQTEKEDDFFTHINANKFMIELEAGQRIDGEIALYAKIDVTASEIRSEVWKSNSSLYSTIQQTATQIRTEVANTSSGIYSTITQTASQIRSEVAVSDSRIYSTITQTASQIRSEVANTDSQIYSAITQTASQIRSEVATTDSQIYSAIEQTATQIRSEVANTTSNLQSSITQNADKISLVVTETQSGNAVNSAEIVAGINGQTGSYVKIKADTINLSGYVTASELTAVDARIDNLASGTTQANYLNCYAFRCGAGLFTLGSSTVSKGTFTAVTSVDFTNGTYDTTTFNYLKY